MGVTWNLSWIERTQRAQRRMSGWLGKVAAGILCLAGATSCLLQVAVIGYSHQYEVVLGEGITGGLVFILAAAASLAFLPTLANSITKQVVVVVVLLVSCTMASLLSVLSTLRLLAVPHDIYYIHYGLVSLMCNLYSGLLACGLIAGLASLTLLTVTCLGLPFCTTHNQVSPLGQKKEEKVAPAKSAKNGGWR